MTAEGFACVTLDWLYDNIEKRVKNAEGKAHAKFLAARTIQATYRGWRTRVDLENKHIAATNIQKNWKMYQKEKEFYDFLEDTLNERTIDWHNYNATIIQKWWRGYIVRLKVHDHRKLKANQLEAAKELIICIAYKLHHLLRTRVTPGIYSLQNSKALSKVEKLLASLKFKEYNDAIRKLRSEKAKMAADATYNSRMSAVTTKVPFGVKCPQYYKTTKIEKMFSELNKFGAVKKPPDNVSGNVMKSMKRWNIVKGEKELIVPPSIVQKPENIESFIGEMETICHEQHLIPEQNVCCPKTC